MNIAGVCSGTNRAEAGSVRATGRFGGTGHCAEQFDQRHRLLDVHGAPKAQEQLHRGAPCALVDVSCSAVHLLRQKLEKKR